MDAYINTGLNILSMILVGSALIISMRAKVSELATDMSDVRKELEKLVSLQIQQGRHEERMTSMDQRILAQGQRLDAFIGGRGKEDERSGNR
jgi:hypothetical protein